MSDRPKSQETGTPMEKKWDREGDKWNHEAIAGFTGVIASAMFERFSELTMKERSRRVSEFTRAIKAMDINETGCSSVQVGDGKGLTICFVEPCAVYLGGDEDKPVVKVGAIYHNLSGELVGHDLKPISSKIVNEPRLDLVLERDFEMSVEEHLQRLKEMQLAAVDLNTNPDFSMYVSPRSSHYSEVFGRDLVSRSVASFHTWRGTSLYEGRGTVRFTTGLQER